MTLKRAPVCALVVALFLGAVGTFLGFTRGAAEPGGRYVSCDRVLFRDPRATFPPECADSYAPFDTISMVLLVGAVAALVAAVVLLVRVVRERAGRAAG